MLRAALRSFRARGASVHAPHLPSRSYCKVTVLAAVVGGACLASSTAPECASPADSITAAARKPCSLVPSPLPVNQQQQQIQGVGMPLERFKLFASATDAAGDPVMTKADFVRALLSFGDDAWISPAAIETSDPPSLNGIGDARGLVSYSEFVFLQALLTVPEGSLSLWFRMFDSNANGVLCSGEFTLAMQSLSQQPTAPLPARLGKQLFGPKYPIETTDLSFSRFAAFVTSLRHDVLALELRAHSLGSEHVISPAQLAAYLTRRLGRVTPLPSADLRAGLAAVDLISDEPVPSSDVWALASAFSHHGSSILDALAVMSPHHCTPAEFSRAVRITSGVVVPKHLTSVLFAVFGVERPGRLSALELRRAVAVFCEDRGIALSVVPPPLVSYTGVRRVDQFLSCAFRDLE